MFIKGTMTPKRSWKRLQGVEQKNWCSSCWTKAQLPTTAQWQWLQSRAISMTRPQKLMRNALSQVVDRVRDDGDEEAPECE